MHVIGVANPVRPKVSTCCIPFSLGVYEHRSGGVLEIAYAFLRNTVLVMCVHSTEGNGLSLSRDVLLEGVLGKASIFRVVVADVDSVSACPSLERLLGLYRLIGLGCALHVHKGETAIVVDEDGSGSVSCSGRCSLELGD